MVSDLVTQLYPRSKSRLRLMLVIRSVWERLSKGGANLNTMFPETLLFIAGREGRADCLEILQKAGSNVNVKSNCGQNPMHIVCSEVHESCVELLLSLMTLKY